MASARRCCCSIPPLKYLVRYGKSRHCRHFGYITFNTLGGTLLYRTLLLKRGSWSHQSRRCRSSKWDAINVSCPNTPALFLPHIYCHRTCRPAYLILYLYSVSLVTLHIFCCPHCLASLIHLCCCCLDCLTSPPHIPAVVSAAILIHRPCHLACLITLSSST